MAIHSTISVRQIISRNPATGDILGSFDCAGPDEVRAAVTSARAAQGAWAATPIQRRIEILRRFQRLL